MNKARQNGNDSALQQRAGRRKTNTMDEATKLTIGPEEVAEAAQILQRYKAGKAALDKRLVDNELWFRMGHWKNYQNPIVLLSKTQCTIRYCLDSVSLNFKCIIPFCFIGCQDVSFLLWSNCGQTTPTNDFSPPAKLHRAISIFINRSCAFCLHELSIRRICQPCQ